MEDTGRRAVERAIATMRANLGEPLTMDDLARAALFSKFYFSRLFQQATGVSPARFLSAMRLAEAKRLLRCTPITVTSISHQVGYSSVGTFSTQFSIRVGTSPNSYRHFGSVELADDDCCGDPNLGIVRGNVVTPMSVPDWPIFVGLFPGRIPEGRPIRHTMLDRAGPYVLRDVPMGTWYLLAHLMEPGMAYDEVSYIGARGSIDIQPGVIARLADVPLRPVRSFDPPLLVALPRPRVPALAELTG
jgi:AraC family transcriptional regulator